MKAALYIRVSTEEQVEGFSLSAQLNLLTKYCESNNIEIYKVYADEGISGQKENRPEFQKMIHDAENKLFDVILVHKYDRFARKVELSQKVKNRLQKCGVNVISITEPLEDSPMGFFVGGLHDLLAEYYVRNLAVESKKGHIERARQGLHNGSVPFGYKIDRSTGNMVINEEQAEIVRLIFHMYNHQGYGSTKIAMILNENKVATAVRGQWSHFTVNRILKNPKYIGKIYYDGEIYDGQHEPIISEEEFELARKNMVDRTWKRSYRGTNFEKYLLLGITKCGECGRVFSIVVSKTRKAYHYYHCNGDKHTYSCKHRKLYQAEKLETYIINYLKEICENMPADIKIVKKEPIQSLYQNRKIKLLNELERAKEGYLAGVFNLEEYKELKQKYEYEISQVEKEIIADTPENDRKNLQSKIVSCWTEFESTNFIPEKRAILQRFIDVIYIYKDKIEIIFYC